MKKFTQSIKLTLAALAIALIGDVASAQLTTIPQIAGGNDTVQFQSFGATNTTVSATVYNTSGTNGVALGVPVDISMFDRATVVVTVTNAYASPSTNSFTLLRGWNNGNVISFETTATIPTMTVTCPANSFVCWVTNLGPDGLGGLAGVAALRLGSLTNSGVTSTNGYYAIGFTNVFGLSTNTLGVVTGSTNIVGYPFQIGVATKVLRAPR